MRLSEVVEVGDVEEASRLIREAIKESATDPRTGLLDLALLENGAGVAASRQTGDLKQAILEILVEGRRMKWSEVARQLDAQSTVSTNPADFNETVQSLIDDGLLQVSGERTDRRLRRLDV